MSQTINIITPGTTYNKLQEDLIEQAENYIFNRRFMLGKGVSEKKRNHALASMSFICEDNCEVLNNLNSVMRGLNKECKKVKRQVRPKKSGCYSCGTRTDFSKDCKECMVWINKEW